MTGPAHKASHDVASKFMVILLLNSFLRRPFVYYLNDNICILQALLYSCGNYVKIYNIRQFFFNFKCI